MMYLSRALGAALLAVPLAGAAGQSAPQHVAAQAANDSSSGHRFAWIATAGVGSAAVFTTFVRLSDQRAGTSAELSPVIPGTPVPDRYVDASLPGNGTTTSHDTPPPGDTTSKGSGPVVGGSQVPDVIGTPVPPGPIVDLPHDTTSVTDGSTAGDPKGGTNNPPTDPPPPPRPQTALSVVVTTPEPETFSLLGTGLIALAPLVRRRRSMS